MLTNNRYSTSFFTCCYKADWEFFLKEGRLKEMIERCNHTFTSRNLIINNVNDKEEVKKYAALAVQHNIIDNYFFSEDYIQDVLQKFSLKRKGFRLDGYDGYWYSVGPLTASYVCSTDYILYFAGDCMLTKKYDFDWVENGIKKLQQKNIFCITPLWDYYNKEAEFTSFMDDGNYLLDQGFSDQCFLVKAENLRGNIYNEYNARSEVFPIYGGNHFERRLFCYINNRNYLRATIKTVVYRHDKLVKPDYIKVKKLNITDEAKYIIAKFKKKFRRRNILVKLLLR